MTKAIASSSLREMLLWNLQTSMISGSSCIVGEKHGMFGSDSDGTSPGLGVVYEMNLLIDDQNFIRLCSELVLLFCNKQSLGNHKEHITFLPMGPALALGELSFGPISVCDWVCLLFPTVV